MLEVSKIKPLKNQVLIKRSSQKQSLGKILLPESSQEKPKEGEVIAVGPEALSVKPKDDVLFSSYAGTELTVEDESYLIISEEDIIGILETI